MSDVYDVDQKFSQAFKALCTLRDFAVYSGRDIPDELLAKIAAIDSSDPKKGLAEATSALKALTAITKPVTALNMPMGGRREEEEARERLLRLGYVAFGLTLVGVAVGAYFATRRVEVLGCNNVCDAMFSTSVLVYGAGLGGLGAIAYQLFTIGRVIVDDGFLIGDRPGSYARVLLGGIFGFLFCLVFSRGALESAFMFDPDDGGAGTLSAYVFLLLPFLAGYSSTLVTGLLNKIVEAVSLTLGLESK